MYYKNGGNGEKYIYIWYICSVAEFKEFERRFKF